MSDFVNEFWNLYVMVIVGGSLLACLVILVSQKSAVFTPGQVTGHKWDETLEEYNNPLPKWWSWLFYLTVFFAIGYLTLYPGFGRFQGILGWTSAGQHATELKKAEDVYGPIFAKFSSMEVPAVASDKQAIEMGKRLYLTYCVQCHGADAKGAKGFPNLTDSDWLYGGEPEQLKATIAAGRNGMMPAYGGNEAAIGGPEGAKDVVAYVLSLSGKPSDAQAVAKGKVKFETVCAACHGADGKGMQAIGAPNLTDNVWLYGGSEKAITETITKGRTNQMPAWNDFLGEAKVHLLSAYVYGLSHK
jgi:cytochrome c oxidase cbb3-type subunit III